MGDVLILDADSIAYKAAAANEVRSITTTYMHEGEPVVEHWDNRTAFRKYLEGTAHTEDMYTIEDVQEARHVSYAKTLIKNMIQGYLRLGKTTEHEIYISGEGNFRDDILLPQAFAQDNATQSTIGGQYKSNRDGTTRPKQLKELRAWMITDLGAIPVHGMEVDDKASIRQYEGYLELCKSMDAPKVINCTEDKDALGSSGMLLNPEKMVKPVLIQGLGELHRTTNSGIKGTGRKFFYFQTLFGDPVDGYRPVDVADIASQKAGGKKVKFGEVAVFNLLVNLETDRECWQAIYDQYKSWYPGEVTYTAWDGVEYTKDAVAIMQLYVDCAHMRRWEDDRINVKAVLTKLGII